MDEPLEIEIGKFQRPIGDTHSIATYQQGNGVVVQLWKGKNLVTREHLTYEAYFKFRAETPEYELPNYAQPKAQKELNTQGTDANGNTIGRVIGDTSKTKLPASTANPPLKETTEEGWWNKTSPWVHGTLDMLGFVPGLGAIPDGINAVI